MPVPGCACRPGDPVECAACARAIDDAEHHREHPDH